MTDNVVVSRTDGPGQRGTAQGEGAAGGSSGPGD